MQLSPIDVNVDLDINLTNSVMDSIHVNQYENNVRQIRCHIKNDGVDYSLHYSGTISSDRRTVSLEFSVQKT